MRKIIAAALVALTLVPTVAHADWYGHRHYGPRPGYGGGGGDWVAPLVGGLLIGGILGGMTNQPSYNQGYQQYYYQPQTFCRNEPAYDQYGNYIGRMRRCWQQ